MTFLQERIHSASLPDHWKPHKLQRVFRVRRGQKNIGMQEDSLLSLSYGRIVQKDIDTSEGLLPESFEIYQIVEPGNIVMRLTDLQNDKRSLRQGLVRERGIITSAYDALEVETGHDPAYWAYALLALDLAKYYYSLGGGVRQSIKFADFPNDWIAAPDLDTQKAIAAFLDRETARIDRLIEKKERQEQRLQERQAAIINDAVSGTKDAESRDRRPSEGSGGVRFWPKTITSELTPLKYMARFNPEVLPEDTDSDFEFEYIDIGSVTLTEGVRQKEPMRFRSSPSRARKPVCEGDVIVSTVRTYLQAIARIHNEHSGAVVSTGFAVLRPLNGVDADYLFRACQAQAFLGEVEARSTGVSYPAINPSRLSRIEVPCPNLDTQKAIAASLDSITTHIQKLRSRVKRSIDLLKERRAALITAAVTGQIDVREQPPAIATKPDRRLDAVQEVM